MGARSRIRGGCVTGRGAIRPWSPERRCRTSRPIESRPAIGRAPPRRGRARATCSTPCARHLRCPPNRDRGLPGRDAGPICRARFRPAPPRAPPGHRSGGSPAWERPMRGRRRIARGTAAPAAGVDRATSAHCFHGTRRARARCPTRRGSSTHRLAVVETPRPARERSSVASAGGP